MNLIQEQWDSFAQIALPDSATEIQRHMFKRVFYAGVAAMHAIQWRLSDSSVDEDEAVRALTECSLELEKFVESTATRTH